MDDEEYEIPLRDQRMFGSGLKRKRVQFVQSSHSDAQNTPTRSKQEVTAAEKYLAIVLGKRVTNKSFHEQVGEAAQPDASPVAQEQEEHTQALSTGLVQAPLCEICSRPLPRDETTSAHESSLVHQVCIQHSHPPSHIDRERRGLAVLQSYGWDPDRRQGLGAAGGGILYPVKARENAARAGLGAEASKVIEAPRSVKLDAGKARQAEKDSQKHKDMLRRAFYRDEDVERYLGQLDSG